MTDNTLTGLRVIQWGAEGVQAVGTLTVDTQPTALDTFTIGDIVYTVVASGASTPGQVNRGADLAAAKLNIVAAINGSDGWNVANPAVSASSFSTHVCTLTARLPGTGGSAIVTTETFTAVTNVFNRATLGGTTEGSFARGTAVAATSKIALENLEWGDEDENLIRPAYSTGILARNRGPATATQHGTRFSFSDQPLVWEQLPHLLSSVVEGIPTVIYTGGVYRWTFTRDPVANPNPITWTLERRFSDGNGNYVDQRASYCVFDEITIKWAKNEDLKVSGKGFARKFNTNALTSALSLPTAEIGVSALAQVYRDTTWGALGGTMLAEQVVGFEYKIKSGAVPLATAEGRTDLDFTKHVFNDKEVQLGLKMMLLLDPATYATEAAAAAAGTVRAIQIKVAGSSSRLLKFNGLFQYTKPSLFKIGSQDGQDVVDIELEEAPDTTNFHQVIFDHPTLKSLA